MKKLMMVAAIVCAAAVQAGTIKWSDTAVSGATIYGPDGKTAISTWAGTLSDVVLMNAADYTQSAFLNGLRDGSITFGDKALDKTTVASSKIAAKTTTELTELSGTKVDLYYAILATDATGNNTVLISTLKEQAAVPQAEGSPVTVAWSKAGHTFSTVKNGDADFSAAGWYNVAPEPTSGLMMLLGLGVLALRRRRA